MQNKLLSLRTIYISGHLNLEVDILLRQGLRSREWRFHLDERLGWAEVDLFAHCSTHCLHWFAFTLPAPLGLDAMVETLPRLHLQYMLFPDRSAYKISS